MKAPKKKKKKKNRQYQIEEPTTTELPCIKLSPSPLSMCKAVVDLARGFCRAILGVSRRLSALFLRCKSALKQVKLYEKIEDLWRCYVKTCWYIGQKKKTCM